MGPVDQDSTSNAVGVLREQHLRSDFVSSSGGFVEKALEKGMDIVI